MTRQNAISLFKGIVYVGVYGGLLMPVVFLPYVIFPFVFSKLIFFQILVGLTFPAYVALAWMEPRYRVPRSPLYMAILAYFVAIGLSVVFSTDIMRSWWGNQERMNGMFTLLHFLAWLTMAVGLLKTWTDWRRLLNYEVALSVFMALVCLLQSVKKDLLLFVAGERIGGLLDNPIYMGAYQMFNLSFLALLFMKTKSKTARVWYGVAAVADLAAFALTQSRGALVGLAAVVGTFALYYALFTKNKKARMGILGGAGGLFGAYGLAYLFRDTPFIIGNEILNRLTHFSLASQTRFIAWDIAWKGFLERPLTGWGMDAFHILFNLKYNPRSLEFGQYETWFDRAHNTVMDVLAMTGIFGFITFFAIFVVLFVSLWYARKRGQLDLPTAAVLTALPVGYFLQNLFVFDHPAAFSMSYLLFALIIAATQPGFLGAAVAAHASEKPAAPEQKPSAPRPAPWTIFVITQVIFLLIVWRFSVLPVQASLITIRANQFRAVSLKMSWDLMKQAGAIPTPYLDEQTFLLSRDLIAMATDGSLVKQPGWEEMYQHVKRLSETYISQHPRNTHSYFIYARLTHEIAPLLPQDKQSEEIALSERIYQKAIETSPKRQQLYYSMARLYTMVGRFDLAYDALKTSLDHNPNIGEGWWYAGITKWQNLDQPEEGMDMMLKALKAKAPYTLQNAREGFFLAQAAATRGDIELMKGPLLTALPGLSGGSIDLYLAIAKAYELAGLIQERNVILNAIEQADGSTAPMFEALRNGSATSIDASIAATPKAPPPTAPAATSTAPVSTGPTTQPVVATSSGPGPRR